MKFFILCVILHQLRAELLDRILSIGRQDELAESELSFDHEDLLENMNGVPFYEEKRPLHPKGVAKEVNTGVGHEEHYLQPRLATRSLCSCESEYEIRDLGDGHYPRYLTASRCKPKTCQAKVTSCRLLHYKVHVLQQREQSEYSDDQYSDESTIMGTPLPESLRHDWELKPMSIAVACISNPAKSRVH